jgi:hypothetical protein
MDMTGLKLVFLKVIKVIVKTVYICIPAAYCEAFSIISYES